MALLKKSEVPCEIYPRQYVRTGRGVLRPVAGGDDDDGRLSDSPFDGVMGDNPRRGFRDVHEENATDRKCGPLKYSDSRMLLLSRYSESIESLPRARDRNEQSVHAFGETGHKLDTHGITTDRSWIDPQDLQQAPRFWNLAIALRAKDMGCEPTRGHCVRRRTAFIPT